MRITRRAALSAVAAVLGIISAAVLAWSVSRLVGQRIGLSSQPPSVVRGLVPQAPAPGSEAPSPPRTEDASGSAVSAPAPAGPGAAARTPAGSGDGGGGADGGGRDD